MGEREEQDMAARDHAPTTCAATEKEPLPPVFGDDLFAGEGMSFPALCLWQPFAELPLFDAKPWETRSRPYPAKYHGRRIVVCSTKAYTPRAFRTPALEQLCEAVLGEGYEDRLQRGVALYSIVLKGCERTEDMVRRVPPELLASGDFGPGRFAWEWGEPEPFNPFQVHGGQGWFRVAVKAGAFRCATLAAAPEEASPRQVVQPIRDTEKTKLKDTPNV